MRSELIALVLVSMTSCKCGGDPPRGPSSATGGHGTKGAGTAPLARKEFFRLDAAPQQPACKAGAACEAHLVLTALGDYHVNDKYPFKLVTDATPGVTVEGNGTFTPDGKTGTLAVAFRADKPGTAKIAGTFRLSVCNDDNCQIESPKIAFDVPVN